MSLIYINQFKIQFQNKNWNYINRKWNCFIHFQISDQKTSFSECFTFLQRSSKLIFKIGGNGIIQTGLQSKNFFYKKFLIYTKEFKFVFQNSKWNYPNRKWNYLSHFQASNQKLLLQNVFNFHQGVQNILSEQEMELFILFPAL